MFQVVSPLSHPGGASSPGVSVGGTSRSSPSPSTHIPCCFPQPVVQPHGAEKILQKWECAQQRQEESKEGRMKNRRVVKPQHQHPVDDVQTSPSSSSGSKSPGRAQSSHGKPEHWSPEAPIQGILTRELGIGWASLCFSREFLQFMGKGASGGPCKFTCACGRAATPKESPPGLQDPP